MSDCLLYVISPTEIIDLPKFSDDCARLIATGGEKIGAFQLRLKQKGSGSGKRLTDYAANPDEIKRVSEVLLPQFKAAGISYILNDDAELAQEIGADGVHLGQEDGDVRLARSILGEDAVIGVTCHASKHLAMVAGEAGADYVAFGAFYPTTSKSEQALEHWGVPSLDIIEWWTSAIELPCVAIGGINPQNAVPLIAAGADFIAAISSIWNHEVSVEQAMREFLQVL
jgi:thiamine-phosphate pyrophosphorylase